MSDVIRKLISALGFRVQRIRKAQDGYASYKKLFSEESLKRKHFYNIGAGDFKHKYWTNVDYKTSWYKKNDSYTGPGIQHDLHSLSPIPIQDEVAEVIYSSHTIEHIQDASAQYLFNEIYRILKKNGVVRLTAPDIDLHYSAYIDNDKSFYYWRHWYSKENAYKKNILNQPLNKATIGQLFLHRFATSVCELHADGADETISDSQLKNAFESMSYEDALNFCCEKCPISVQKKYPGNHINWWNREKTIRMLKVSGFKSIYVSGYGQSRLPILRDTELFDSTHPKISFYIEAIK